MQDYERVIHNLVLSGNLRISLHTNSYKKCSISLSLSTKGQPYFEDLKNLQVAKLEMKNIHANENE
jgi:hypothetical protein